MDISEFWMLFQVTCRKWISDNDLEYNNYLNEIELLCKIDSLQAKPSEEKGKISFIRSGKRVKLTTCRFLIRILKLIPESIGIKLNIIENLANQINFQIWEVLSNFSLLKGQEIIDAYKNNIGGSSCMTGENSGKVGLYANNPDKVRLITVEHGNQSARALLWQSDNKKLYYDRIYSNSAFCKTELENKMNEFDIRNIYNSFSCNDDPVILTGLLWERDEMPYLDSFHYGEVIKSNPPLLKLYTHNKNGNDKKVNFSTDCTGGNYFKEEGPCVSCNDIIYSYEHYSYMKEDPGIICQSCLENSDYKRCGNCGRVHNKNEMVLSFEPDGGRFYWCNKCSENISVCSECGKLYRNNEMLGQNILCYDCRGKIKINKMREEMITISKKKYDELVDRVIFSSP